MTMDRQFGKIVYECEGCGEVLKTETGDFNKALELMREEGWKSHRQNPKCEWEHFCPKC